MHFTFLESTLATYWNSIFCVTTIESCTVDPSLPDPFEMPTIWLPAARWYDEL